MKRVLFNLFGVILNSFTLFCMLVLLVRLLNTDLKGLITGTTELIGVVPMCEGVAYTVILILAIINLYVGLKRLSSMGDE